MRVAPMGIYTSGKESAIEKTSTSIRGKTLKRHKNAGGDSRQKTSYFLEKSLGFQARNLPASMTERAFPRTVAKGAGRIGADSQSRA